MVMFYHSFQNLQKDQALATCIQSLLSKNAIQRVEIVKSLGFYSRLFLVPTRQTMVDLTQSLGWIITQEKSELKPTQVFSFVGYEYHLDSALLKPTQERWLNL